MIQSARVRIGLQGFAAVLALVAASCVGDIGKLEPGATSKGSAPGAMPGPGGAGMPPPAGAPGNTGQACSSTASLAPARLWRLTDEQYVNAVSQVFGVRIAPDVTEPNTHPADFTNLSEVVTVGNGTASAYQAAAENAARVAVAANLNAFLPCSSSAPSDSCVQGFIKNRVARAFRRPVTDTEMSALMGIFHSGESGAAGIRLVIEATLQSPSFLYRSELGAPTPGGSQAQVPLTAHEVAAAISFALIDSVPDEPLWAKAEDGTLLAPSVLTAEVERLLALPNVQANLSQKAGFWLGVERLQETEKETTIFKDFTPALKQDLYDSARMFVRDVFNHGTVFDLLTSRRMYVNASLAKVYGVPGTFGAELTATDVQLDERSAGILTQPAVLAAYSRPDRGDPIHRGLFIYNSLVCGSTIPAPPANALDVASTFPANATERQLAELRATNSNGCGACHALFDPLGLSTERYDPIGRYGPSDANGPIDSSSVLKSLGPDLDGPVSGLPDLVTKLEMGRRVSDCAASNLAIFVLGRSVVEDTSCALQAAKDRFATTGAFGDYYRALLTSSGFLTRDADK